MVASLFGVVSDGTFLTGTEHENIRLFTLHDFTPTGVKLTRQELVNEGYLSSATLSASNSITINGTTYTTDSAYDAALQAQKNLDKLYQIVSLKANVVELNVDERTSSNPNTESDVELVGGSANNFGSNYTTSASVWVVDLKLERGGALKVSPNAPQGGNTVGPTTQTDVENFFEDEVFWETGNDAFGGSAGDTQEVLTSQDTDADANQNMVVDFVKYTRS